MKEYEKYFSLRYMYVYKRDSAISYGARVDRVAQMVAQLRTTSVISG